MQAWRDYHHNVFVLQSTRIKYALALHSDEPNQYRKAIDLLRRVDKESKREVETLKKTLDSMTDTIDLVSDAGEDNGSAAEESNNDPTPESSANQARVVIKAS